MKYSIYFWAEVIAFLASVYVGRSHSHTPIRYLPAFLGLIVLYEFGVINNWFTIHHSNLWSVNIITIIEFIFYACYLHSLLADVKKRRELVIECCLAVALACINIFLVQGFWKLHSYTLLLFSVLIVYWVCLFFAQLLRSVDTEMSLPKYGHFWIATGILFFYVSGFLFFAFFEYMAYINDYEYLSLTKILLNLSNIILYSFITIGLVCLHRTHR